MYYLVVEFVGLVLVVNGDGQDGRVRQGDAVRLVYFRVPFRFGELRRHVVDILDSNGGRPRS